MNKLRIIIIIIGSDCVCDYDDDADDNIARSNRRALYIFVRLPLRYRIYSYVIGSSSLVLYAGIARGVVVVADDCCCSGWPWPCHGCSKKAHTLSLFGFGWNNTQICPDKLNYIKRKTLCERCIRELATGVHSTFIEWGIGNASYFIRTRVVLGRRIARSATLFVRCAMCVCVCGCMGAALVCFFILFYFILFRCFLNNSLTKRVKYFASDIAIYAHFAPLSVWICANEKCIAWMNRFNKIFPIKFVYSDEKMCAAVCAKTRSLLYVEINFISRASGISTFAYMLRLRAKIQVKAEAEAEAHRLNRRNIFTEMVWSHTFICHTCRRADRQAGNQAAHACIQYC